MAAHTEWTTTVLARRRRRGARPRMEAYFDRDLAAGDYVLFCMATAQDGRTHIEYGMMQQIRVE